MERFKAILFYAVIGEVAIGGGGRLIAFGPISLRMILFTLAMLVTAIEFFRGNKLPRELARFVIAFLASIVLAAAIGLISGASLVSVLEDVKPLLYVLILPFFFFVLTDWNTSKQVSPIIVYSALAMSILFIGILALIHGKIIPFLSFYYFVIGTGEFFFRAETTFFYKGFLYVCIALIFVALTFSKHRKVVLIILSTCVILTFTRGFIFALLLTWVFYSVIEQRMSHVAVSVPLLILVLLFGKEMMGQVSGSIHSLKGYDANVVPKDQMLGNRHESDAARFVQLREVSSAVSPVSFFVGHGLGNGIPSRPVHMEISYLEIFHKQGVAGLFVWGYLFYLIFMNFKASSSDLCSKAYFYATSFIFFQSITNQFINNPIGLSFALLSLTWLHYKRESDDLILEGAAIVTKKVMKYQ